MKQSDPEACAGAPGTIALGGRTFLVEQATDNDLMAVRKHLKKHVRDPLDMYADVASNPKFRKLPKAAKHELALESGRHHIRREKVLTAEMALDMLMEGPHCRFLAWVLLRKRHPELTLEDLASLIPEDAAPVVFFELQRESSMDALGN